MPKILSLFFLGLLALFSTACMTVTPPTNSTNTPPSSTPTSLETQLEQQLFNLINSDRAKNGLPAYTRNTTLDSGARQHSIKMSQCGLSHQCPGEPAPCDRVTQEGVTWNYCGENVGEYGPVNASTAWNGVQALETAMLNEKPPDDGHRRNLLSTNFHHIGIGIYIDAKGTLWLTEDFTN
ncbi:MAG TPA: CAP domain-containing protein [Ktedonobacteraceae bacterium]|nr:CAP domain-containing protein [Ktedonobacteraceae bacterium]